MLSLARLSRRLVYRLPLLPLTLTHKSAVRMASFKTIAVLNESELKDGEMYVDLDCRLA